MKKLLLLAAILLTSASAFALGQLSSPAEGVGKIPYFYCPASGDMHFPVVLISYQDVDFADDIEAVIAHFNDKYNKEGFDENGATGSVRDYYRDASNGHFTPHFDFLGHVKLPNERAYYGKNRSGVDQNHGDMVIGAFQPFANEIDFGKYDSDGDGWVDNAIVLYAGESEYSGPKEACLPTSYLLTFDKYNDSSFDKRGLAVGNHFIDSYTIINELSHDKYDGIGTFIHEFMHALGLADVYTVYETGAAYTPRTYDVMDTGIYNNSSKTPPTPSAFERYALGWLEPEIIDQQCDIELTPLLQEGNAYIIPVTDNEFYIFENRQKESWDAYIPGHGMIVWHIDYDSNEWYYNRANYLKDHQRIDLVEACGYYSKKASDSPKYTFPGADNVTELATLPTWCGSKIDFAITDIAEATDGTITARVTAASGIEGLAEDATTAHEIYDLQGHSIANLDHADPGIYILKTPHGPRKILHTPH